LHYSINTGFCKLFFAERFFLRIFFRQFTDLTVKIRIPDTLLPLFSRSFQAFFHVVLSFYFVFFRSCEKGFCHISATTKDWNYGIIKIKTEQFQNHFPNGGGSLQ